MPPPVRPPNPRPANPVLPSEGSEVAFRAFVAAIRSAPTLARAAIRSYTGDAADLDGPSDDAGPWVRLTPMPGPSAIAFRSRAGIVHRMPISVTVETSVPGSSVADSQRLWGAILGAVFPSGQIPAAMQAAGISRVEVKRPAWGTPVKGGARCEGMGEIELLLHFCTPE